MRIISSRANPEIIQVHALKQTKERERVQQFTAEGLRVCQTLLEYGTPIYMLYATEAQLAETQEMLIRTKSAAPVTLVSDSVMEKISTVSTPSGILGVFAIPNKQNSFLSHATAQNNSDLIASGQSSSSKQTGTEEINNGLVLAQITDPGNMGTLIRSAVAVGVKNIFIVEGVDPWSPKVVHASAGTIGGATILQLNWPELCELKGKTPLYGLVVRGGQPLISIQPPRYNSGRARHSLGDGGANGEKASTQGERSLTAPPSQNNLTIQKSLTDRNLLVVGNESRGIPDAWLKDCEQLVTLPMPGGTESLNAAVAGSIALYLLHACSE